VYYAFATHLSLDNLAKYQNEREGDSSTCYTHPPKNDRFSAITPTEHEWRTLLADREDFCPQPSTPWSLY